MLEQGKNVPLQRFHLGTLRRNGLRHGIHTTTHEGGQLREFSQPHPFQALGKNEPVGNLSDQRVALDGDMSVSSDGRRLFMSQIERDDTDLTLIENFR